ncbi:RND transporter [Adhaeribacter aerolatus]|uniref:RND transporter n=1 Tax=Adhaeribacter aerolatus TaxID=670289 RepID=A0A512AZ40_9BACT|nr:RND transporter [Adhaeribacter aerolatus]
MFLPLALVSCRENHPDHAETGTTYTCPMHPQIVKDEPGSCPICGMDLVPQRREATEAATVAGDLNYLLQPTNQTVIANIKTITPVTKEVNSEITFPGIITYDTRRQYTIPARFGGRIEKLYVQFNYQPVRKGQKLYDIYSPDLITAQNELIYLLEHDAQNTDLIRAAKQKLQYLGATEAQISQISRQREANYTFPVYSPYNGYVVDPTVTTPPTYTAVNGNNGAGSGGMADMSSAATGSNISSAPPAPATPGFSVREGMYVTAGQTLFRVVNADEVWAEFNVSSTAAANLKKGTPVTLFFNQLPETNIKTRIHLVQPFYEAGESFAQVRVLLPTQHNSALVGQLVTGKIAMATDSALWVPKSAVLDLGSSSVVFRKLNGVFQPIEIIVGKRSDDLVEVQKGLDIQTEIAANAQFLVDSESFIRVADNR